MSFRLSKRNRYTWLFSARCFEDTMANPHMHTHIPDYTWADENLRPQAQDSAAKQSSSFKSCNPSNPRSVRFQGHGLPSSV